MSAPKHTAGPWHRNIKPARKYAAIFAGRNTHVAAIKSDGLTDEEIEANCDLIACAPDLLKGIQKLYRAYVNLLEIGRDQILDLGGECDPVDRMEDGDLALRAAREIIAKAMGVA